MRIFENIDCMEGMQKYKDILLSHKTLAICDPPYGIGYENGGQYYDLYQGKKWDEPPKGSYFIDLFNYSERQIIWGGNYFRLPVKKGWICWFKTVELQDRTFSEFELAWTNFDEPARLISLKPFQRNGSRIHPTQKPIALYKWLLEKYGKDHNLILDTHVGSASSLIACEEMGFDYIGFELDKDYYQAAQKRIEQYRSQEKLFKPEPKIYEQLELKKY